MKKKKTAVNRKIIVRHKDGFTPRTALGMKLMSLRNRAIASGMKLLSEDEILNEVRRRRGEL